MKKLFPNPLLIGLLLLPLYLTGQGLDWATTFRYNTGTIIGDIEPKANGLRHQSVHTLINELELRGNARLGWLIGMAAENIETSKEGNLSGDIGEPFNIIHPYSSQLSTVYLRLGAQYNLRILEGDLSVGLLVGPGAAVYSRNWDVLNLRVVDGDIITNEPTFTTLTNESTVTSRLQAALRVQYTYWFTPALAFSAGVEYTQSHYLGGGITTFRGERYEIEERRFIPGGVIPINAPLIYDLNYDQTTLRPDPSRVIHQIQLTLGITSRF